jgi:hypothetical protein
MNKSYVNEISEVAGWGIFDIGTGHHYRVAQK